MLQIDPVLQHHLARVGRRGGARVLAAVAFDDLLRTDVVGVAGDADASDAELARLDEGEAEQGGAVALTASGRADVVADVAAFSFQLRG
jgi:hypothetical protein